MNRSRGNSDQYRRSNFAQNLKHATSPAVTMSTMLSALRIIIYSGAWLAQRRSPNDAQTPTRLVKGLKKEKRSQGETWVLFFRTVRKSDGKRVENKIPIGLVKDFSSTNSAWEEVERQHLHINQVDFRGCVTFVDLAHHYAEHELVERRTHRIYPSKGTHDNQRLRASAPQSTAATMGEPSRAQRRTAGGGTMVEVFERSTGSCQSNARPDAPCYVAGASSVARPPASTKR